MSLDNLTYDGHNVAVYGTLKKTGPNNGLLADAKYLGTVIPQQKGILFLFGSHLPALCLAEPLTSFTVEVYQTDQKILRRIDMLENVPNFYMRQQLYIEPYGFCWIYTMPKPKVELCTHIVADGVWRGSVASKFAVFRGWGFGADGIQPLFPKTIPEGLPRVREFRSLRSDYNHDELILVDKVTGERHGPFPHKGFVPNKDGKLIPSISAAVYKEIKDAIKQDPKLLAFESPSKGVIALPPKPQPAPVEEDVIAYEEHLSGPGATTF